MNSLILAGSLLLAFEGTTQMTQETHYESDFLRENTSEVCCSIPQQLDLNEIVFIEATDTIELGFDTAAYLPEGFDPHVGDLNEIVFIEEEPQVELGFDTAAYLPESFDAHVGDLSDIVYVDEMEEVELGFDTAAYLPKGFDPHVGVLSDIVYIDMAKEDLTDCEFGLWIGQAVDCKRAGIMEMIASPSATTLVAVR